VAEDWYPGIGWPNPNPAPVEAKAETGSGWVAMASYPQIESLSRSPQKLMAEAQALFHTQTWVAAAERAIVGRYVRAPYHLEQADGDTVGKDASPAEQAVLNLIERPSEKRSRRQLWSLTLRHMGLCGNGFWHLDQRLALDGTPLEVLYVNPARMTPVEDQSKNLLGWIMDKADNPMTRPGATPVPFELDELIHFMLDEPDFGHWGIGIAEAAYSKLLLDKLADSHTAQVLASGGRIAGLLSPKQGATTMNEEQWKATVKDYRQIVADPDAAKRLHIVRGPVDFTETASNPNDLQLAELSEASRENILAAWGVPLSQIGIMQTSGLNSGEHVKYEEAALWQGAIDYRADPFEEKVQRELLDLFKLDLTLIVDTPAFDDQQPLYENAEKAKVVPLTVDERRALVGLDPLEDKEVGAAIFLDKAMVQINTLGPEQEDEPELPAKAALPDDLARLRKRVERELTPQLRSSMEAVFADIGKDVRRRVDRLSDHLKLRPDDIESWWNEERWYHAFDEALRPTLQELVTVTGSSTSRRLNRGKADGDYIDRVLEYVRLKGGDRIRGMLRTTRDAIAAVVSNGIRDGLSPAQLGDAIESTAGLDEYRAELISRTETMLAYNDAAIGTYREFGVGQVQAIDGDVDAECAARNGAIFSLDEASGITDHPNGTLDWVPVVEAKADPMTLMAESVKAVLERPLPTPYVNLYPPNVTVKPPNVNVYPPQAPEIRLPDVHVAPPNVTVNVPEQPAPQVTNVLPEPQVTVNNVPAAKAQEPQQVEIVSMPDRVKRATRNKKGEITYTVEGDI
jgi:HK97 family phage portal protein